MNIKDAFPHLDNKEEIVLVLRKHPFVIIFACIKGLLMVLLPIFLYIIIININPDAFELTDGSPVPYLAVLGFSIYYLFLCLVLFIHWLEYYLDIWVVTNQRVINIDQRRLFSRRVSEVRLSQVQDVTTEVEGMFHTFIKFGDIDLQTAATESKFTFKNIPKPDEVRETILKLMEKHQSKD